MTIAEPTKGIRAMNKKDEPPSSISLKPSLFLVGKDSHGQWVVRDQGGGRGGFFIGRTEALKYAMFENGNRPEAVIMVPGVLELDMSAKSPPGPPATPQASLQRFAA
jgi:hypothetical protein